MPVGGGSVTSILRQGLRYFWSELNLNNFAGGLNLRDAAPELAPNESPDMWNVTLDERGGVMKRLGYSKWNGSVYGAALVKNIYYWATGTSMVVQCGASVYLGTSTTAFHTFTTAARVGFADFAGKLWLVHPVDGLFQSDGTSVGTTAVASSPKGSVICAWQNRLIVAGDPTNPAELYGSGIGDGTDWSTAVGHGWTNQLRDNSASGSADLIVAMTPASGVDIQGRPGMIVCKRNVTYRVYDSDTGAYGILDNSVGAASSLCLVNSFGRTYILSPRGLYSTDGVGALQPISQKLDPLFQPSQLAWDQLDLWCAGVKGDRIRLSMPRAGSTANDLAVEYHPLEGWFSAGSNAVSCYGTNLNNTQTLLGGATGTNGQVWQLDSGGSDNGAAIASRFQTRWLEPTAGHPIRIRRLRVSGNGIFQVNVFKNYDLAASEALPADITGQAATYDDGGNYDDGVSLYGPLKIENYEDFSSLEVMKAVSFQITETSTLTYTGQQLLGGGTGPTIGAWAVYGIDLMYVPLGLS